MQLPFFVLVGAEWFDKDKSTAEARILKGAPLHVIPINEKRCAAVFTTEEQADKYIKWRKLEDKNRAVRLEMPHECATVLEIFARAGIEDVIIDIAGAMPGGLYPISYFLEQVRSARLERGDNRRWNDNLDRPE